MRDRESGWCEGGRVGSSRGKSASHSIFKKAILSGVCGKTVSRFWEILIGLWFL